MIHTSSHPATGHSADADTWPTYSIYGLAMASDFLFTNHLVPTRECINLSFTCVTTPPVASEWKTTTPIYTRHSRAGNGVAAYLYRLDACDLLRITPFTDFYLWPKQIVCHLLDPAHRHMVEIYLLGSLLSFWLERRGIPVLHATAVAVNGKAAAFLSNNRGGKSVLAATLMQAGYPLLTDDALPVGRHAETFVGYPAYPQMRLWPDEARHFLGRRPLELLHPTTTKCRIPIGDRGFGAFCPTTQPLACLYLPQRDDPRVAGPEVEISPVSPRDAVIELVRHSFIPCIVTGTGLQPRRLTFFANLARHIPVRRLRYPAGLEHLPCVRDAILQDLASLREGNA